MNQSKHREDGFPPAVACGYATPPYMGRVFEEEQTDFGVAVNHVLDELAQKRKILVSYSQAIAYYERQALTQGIKVTVRDVEDAYNIAFGGGCEYEWRYD